MYLLVRILINVKKCAKHVKKIEKRTVFSKNGAFFRTSHFFTTFVTGIENI